MDKQQQNSFITSNEDKLSNEAHLIINADVLGLNLLAIDIFHIINL